MCKPDMVHVQADSFVSPARVSMRSMSTSDFVDRAAVVGRQVAIRRGIRYRTQNLVMEQKKVGWGSPSQDIRVSVSD